MSIKDNILNIKEEISNQVKLVAVSKTRSIDEIKEAYNSNQKIFGENRVQEIVEKHQLLPNDIEWHMIGHLQKNKVKYISEFISLIHSLDRLSLANEIDKNGKKHDKSINCLIQIKIAQEDIKSGFNINELDDVMKYSKNLENINIVGLMGMSTFTNNQKIIENEFTVLSKAFKKRKSENFRILSMGMSNDYEIAIEAGSNMIRIGSLIFGSRN